LLVAAALMPALVTGCASPTHDSGPVERQSPAQRNALRLPAIDRPAARPDRLLLIAVPGLQPQHYLGGASAAPAAPLLAELAEAGAAALEVEGVAPAEIYTAAASAITGRLPGAHGITVERRIGARDLGGRRVSRVGDLRAPALWQRASELGFRVASIAWPTTEGAALASVLSDCEAERGETWLANAGRTLDPSALAALERGGERFAEGAVDRPGAERDRVLTEVACDWLAARPGPALFLIRLSGLDVASRRFGPKSHESITALAQVDQRIEELLTCSARSVPLEASAVILAGLRSIHPVHTQIAPNALLARAGLLAAGGAWSALARSNGGSAFVYATSERAALRARSELLAEAQRSRAFRVVPAEELLPLGADPEAWFGLRAEPGYRFVDASDGAVLAASEPRGEGGYLPDTGTSGWLAWGQGFRSGLQIPRMRLTDTAPTAARLLGFELAPEGELDGRALIGALAVPAGAPASVR
jgi:hypothetical protein